MSIKKEKRKKKTYTLNIILNHNIVTQNRWNERGERTKALNDKPEMSHLVRTHR